MRIIFEDNDNIPSSELLKVSDPDNIIFAKSNSKIIKQIRGIARLHKDEHILVYIDLVPDNPRLLQVYHSIKDYVSVNPNIIIIPVICIEYYLAKVIRYFGYDIGILSIELALSSVKNRENWRSVLPVSFDKCESLEKVFKEFFCEGSKYLSEYYWNITKNEHGFYSCDDRATVYEKSCILWGFLPFSNRGVISKEVQEKYNFSISPCTWDDVRSLAKGYINDMTELYKAYGYELDSSL